MKSLEESVITAMDGTDVALFPFIPYILQDLWEIGSSPKVIIELVKKHMQDYTGLKVLDLGCGKGAVSIKLANELKCKCFGIDAITEFIEEAEKKAGEFGVDHLCSFKVDDIRKTVNEIDPHDVIILGSIGPVLGDFYSTLTSLSGCIKKNGIIILDDGYIEDDSDYAHPLIQKKRIVFKQIRDAGMHLIEEIICKKDEIMETDKYIFGWIKKRCDELIEKYPDKKNIFEDYIKNQEIESNVLETKIVCSTMVIRKKL